MKPEADAETVWRDGLSERELADVVAPELDLYADRWYHTHDSRRSPEGFPDYTIIVGPWLIFAELKRKGGSPTEAQAGWLKDLRGPWRLCLLVGGMDGADQLRRVVAGLKGGGLPPFEVAATVSAVQVLGAISPRGRLAVVDAVGQSDGAAADATMPPKRCRLGKPRQPRGS